MNAVYPSALKAALDGGLTLLASTVKMQLVEGYVYSSAHDFFNDVGAGTRVGTAGTLTGKSTTAGVFTATVPTFTPAAGHTVNGLVVYVDTGTEATSSLLAFLDTRADFSPISIVTTGSVITLSWGATPLFTI